MAFWRTEDGGTFDTSAHSTGGRLIHVGTAAMGSAASFHYVRLEDGNEVLVGSAGLASIQVTPPAGRVVTGGQTPILLGPGP